MTLLPNDPIILGHSRAAYPVGTFTYPGGEPGVKWGSLKTATQSLGISRKGQVKLLVRTTKMDEFCAAMFLVDALVERGNRVPHLILPQIPGARQDRLNDEGDFLFTAKSIAGMINARNFPTVTVLDPHSEVSSGLIDRCKVIHVDEIIARVRDPWPDVSVFDGEITAATYEGVIAPDAGAAKRAGSVAKLFKVPLYQAWKTRDIATGQLTGFGCQDLPETDGKFLIVDDICDGGGTFIGLAEALPDVRLDLYVTHGIFSKGLDDLAGHFENIITTDSVIQPNRHITTTHILTIIDASRRIIERNIVT